MLEGLALLGWLCIFTNLFFKCIHGIVSLFHRPITYMFPTQVNFDFTHRDPTRPRFYEDEAAAWGNVTDKMQQFEKRAIEGRKKP